MNPTPKRSPRPERAYELRSTTCLFWTAIAERLGYASGPSACESVRAWCLLHDVAFPRRVR